MNRYHSHEAASAVMSAVIEHMETCGWEEVTTDAGTLIVNPNVTDDSFANWEEAIKSCIEVASEV